MARRLFVLGGTGFVGAETVREAVAQGWTVEALARSDASAERLRALGAAPIRGDAAEPGAWIAAAAGADVLVDLTQPALPARIRRRDIEAVSRERQASTRAILEAVASLPTAARPLLFSVSGTDDLAPGADGRVGAESALRDVPVGFAHVGIPVRRLVEASGLPAAFLYLGTVYGPGKSFAATLVPAVARGRLVLPRRAGRVALVHVRDAARAIVHLAGLGRARVAGRTWVVADAEGGTTLGAFFDDVAARLGVAPPWRVPGLLLSPVVGRVLLETMTREVRAEPRDLAATGFAFAYPTFREGVPAMLDALGYGPAAPGARHGRRGSSWRVLLATAAAALVAVNVLDLPLTVPRLRALAGGLPPLDLRFGYGPADAHDLLAALGGAGRAAYARMLWTLDLVLPALFTWTLWAAIGAGALRRWRWAALACGALDYAENLAITALLLAFPARADWLVRVASALTVAKFAAYAGALALSAAGAVLARRGGARPAAAA